MPRPIRGARNQGPSTVLDRGSPLRCRNDSRDQRTVSLGSGPPDVDRLGVRALGTLPAGPSGDGYGGRDDGSLVGCTSHF
jgi:hypothetical protein